MKYLRLALIAYLACSSSAWAADRESHARIQDVALAYAQAQTRTLPGKIRIKVEDIDRRTVLPACARLTAFLPSGSVLLGKTSIGVSCNENEPGEFRRSQKPGWSIFVQADIKVTVDMLVASRPLAQNTVLSASDFRLQNGELGQPGILIDPQQAIGKTLRFPIGAGQVLRQDMLRAPYVVIQGKTTSVRVKDTGFYVSATGQALNNGAEGQNVQVRMYSGQVVIGTAAADGSVEVHPL
ncbi:flagellar basal body P-ring formation chaperone FlgA [Sideroxydans lithotrophicus]|uniref:Flagella basal body P-ring formation protein FlgA n=1 Tax=Sideroxydans lithotrophicus (strain ES-1) TaxID=580332 RepID=D5CMW8_SIDLE|nr:flagellar basal body P-ring formation chaperone FlgA [Sideroxydans lithotrophicus]ADE10804.1 flagella basal body P-ring formation protein FlgA [Sideroxydans lithotrophicus ES-1]